MVFKFKFAGLAASRLLFHVFQIPAVEGVPLHRAEELFPQVGIAALQLGEQLLHLLPAAVTVHGAGVAYHGKVQLRRHAADVRFLTVQQGADLGDVRPVQIRHRLEAADPTLEQQVHQKRLHRVVVVVSQGDLADPPLRQCRMQAAPAQLGAQGAGVLFFAFEEHDVVHRHGDAGVGHVQRLAVVGDGGEVHARHTGLQGDRLHLEGLGVELPETR